MKPETRATASQQLIRRELMYTRTMTVGRVTKIFSNGWVEVDPQIQMVERDNNGVERPKSIGVLSRIPVALFKAGGFVLTLPVSLGDEGMIFFSDRSLSLWKETGKKAPPRETEFHGLSGAVFMPCPTSRPGAIKNFDSTALYAGLEDRSAFLRISPGGKINIKGAELTFDAPLSRFTGNVQVDMNLAVQLITQLLGAVTTGSTITSAGIHTAPDFIRT